MQPDSGFPSPYARGAPSVQQTLDLFQGKWASAFPDALGVSAGQARLFEDPRIEWALAKMTDFGIDPKRSSFLELGPLEGAHTYMLSRLGVPCVTAVEAHPEAYLKCLVTKELLGVERVNFLFGDAVEFLRNGENIYDVGFVCGFLYHMKNPIELLELVARRCRSIFLWTVHWDAAFSRLNPGTKAGSDEAEVLSYKTHQYHLHKHYYGEVAQYSNFWGGPAPYSMWMEKDELLSALSDFGFTRQSFETEINPNGAALKLFAVKD